MPDLLGRGVSRYIKSRGAGDAYLLPLELYWGGMCWGESRCEGGFSDLLVTRSLLQ